MTTSGITTRTATAADAARIADIYNQGIAGRGATFETVPRTSQDILDTLRAGAGRFPFLAAEADGRVIGWASVSS